MIAKITLNRAGESDIQIHENPVEALHYLILELEKEKSTQHWPDYIFLDLNMPVMDGWEFLDAYYSKIYKSKPEIKIVILSSSVDPADRLKAFQYPFVAEFVAKPMPENILALLEYHES
jgi:CheY-like chemotaxis protein